MNRMKMYVNFKRLLALKRIFFMGGIILCILNCGAQNNRLPTDKEFFQLLNLNYPGLEAVKQSVEKNDYKKAKKEFVIYLKNRTTPKWYFCWRDFATDKGFKIEPDIITYADRHVNNELLAHGTWHKYGDKIDWTVDYSYDHYDEWVWQLNIHYCWVNLADAYWATGDEKYAKAFVKQLNSWINQCSTLTNRRDGSGSVWRPLDAGQRMQRNWPVLFNRFLLSPSFDDETIIKMIKSFYQHGVHLRNHPTANNWLTLEMSGLYIVGGFFPEFKEAAEWRSFAANTLYEEEQKLFYPDGAEIELTPGYHAVSASSMVTVYRFAHLNGYKLPNGFIERLENAYELFVKLRMPDGTLPALNDSEWLNSKRYLSDVSDLFPHNESFKYFVTDGKEGKLPSYTSVWMPWAGWYVMRSDWSNDAFYALFEVGPYGSAHQHEDKLSFILYAYGTRLITESGYYSYDQSDWRKYTQSARGHNVARVDGNDQNRYALIRSENILYSRNPLNNKWDSDSKHDIGEGFYLEGYGSTNDKTVTHHRTLEFVKSSYWIVTDTFTPTDTNNHTYETWFHFNTSSYCINDGLGIVYSDASQLANIAIIALSGNSSYSVVVGQKLPELEGWKSVVGGGNGFHCEPVATPTFRTEGKGVVSESYVFIPYPANQPMPVVNIRKISKKKYRIYMKNGKDFTVRVR